MDHKTFLSSLSPDKRAALTERSTARGLIHLAGHVSAILLCSVLIVTQVPFWQAVMVLQGILLVFLFTLLHETSHNTPFASNWINNLVGQICGFLLFLPAGWFRYFHLAHHRFTQIPGKDPELATPKPATLAGYLRHVSGLPVWASQARTLLGNAFLPISAPYVPEGRHGFVRREARYHLAGYLLLFLGSLLLASPILLTLWILPLLLGQPFLRLYLLAEHGRCPMVANMFENTRTTFTSKLVRALAWNMPYHAEHHSFPSVPFHRLPELHALAAPHLRVTAPGYAAFNRDYVKSEIERP